MATASNAAPASVTSTLRVALVGNPNTGKSTLFNALAGMNVRTGNYPGVTIEKKIGRCNLGVQSIELVDLPGTYSLAPRSPDELVAVEVLTDDLENEPPVKVDCLRRQCNAAATQSVSGQPAVGAWQADRDRVEHDRRRHFSWNVN